MPLDEKQVKKVNRAGTFAKNPDLAKLSVFEDIADSLEKLAGAETVRIEGKRGEKGDKGDKGEKGNDGLNGKDGRDGIDGKNGKDGKDGRDGVDGTDGRDGKDGKDGEMGKIDIATIAYLEDEIKKIGKRIDEVRNIGRGGGTSAIGVAQAFKYIAHTEAPVGAIDGANLSYTVKNTIFWVAGFTLNGEQIAQIPNFTVSGRTITFSSALPAVYSGKDFEVKYIGH